MEKGNGKGTRTVTAEKENDFGTFKIAWATWINQPHNGPHQPNTDATPSKQHLNDSPPAVPSPAADNPISKEPNTDDNDHESDGNSKFEDNLVHRTSRVTVLPIRLNDYELNMNELMLLFDDEPQNVKEAIVKPERLKAMKYEIESIDKNNTWILVPLPKHAKAISLKWLYKIKRNMDGTISRYKARLVAKGYIK